MTREDSQKILNRLLRITQKEVLYLNRVTQKLQKFTLDLAWINSLENNDEHQQPRPKHWHQCKGNH